MKPETLAEMKQLAEARPMATASVPMTGNELMRAIDRCFYPPMNTPIGGSFGGQNVAPSVLIDALEKLDYAKDDLAVLRAYFKMCADTEAARNKASRALSNLREEGYKGMPKDIAGSNGEMAAMKSY